MFLRSQVYLSDSIVFMIRNFVYQTTSLDVTTVKKLLHLRKSIQSTDVDGKMFALEKGFFAASSDIIANILDQAAPNDPNYFINGKLGFISECARNIV